MTDHWSDDEFYSDDEIPDEVLQEVLQLHTDQQEGHQDDTDVDDAEEDDEEVLFMIENCKINEEKVKLL